jgi:hypothetical protein
MIRNYQAFLERRWNELDMPAKIRAAADNEEIQKPIQVPWLVQVVGELRHTTMHEGRQHPDVGVLLKETGNHFDAGNGLKIASDIILVRDTNDAGEVTDPRVFGVIDCIVSVNRHAARPGWLLNGMAPASDFARWREAAVPATAPPPAESAAAASAPTPVVAAAVAPAAVDNDSARALAQIAALLQEMRAAQDKDHALHERILEALDGLRRDVATAGKTLGALAAGGGLGNIMDMFKR